MDQTMPDIILKITNDEKDLIVKLEDLIDVSNSNKLVVQVKIGGKRFKDKTLFINGHDINELPDHEVEYNKTNSYIFSINVSKDFDFGEDEYVQAPIDIDINNSNITKTIWLYIIKTNTQEYKTYDKQSSMIASNMESFMLLRTNPKLTGNIKLVVTEDYNLYLDTFKISNNSILNKQEYRHQPVSSDGNYPYDVYNVFKFLPATEMYGVYEDSYDPHISYHKIDDQIRNIYEYGVEYNSDKLYSENMKILAPLYIGKHLPDYFAIWRTDRIMTINSANTNTEIFKQLLNEGKCIKIFDLRQYTTIGKYLHSYQNMITKYHAGSCALQFIEQDNDKNSIDHRQGQNTWKGVAYDKGILTDRNETTYFATQTLDGEKSQENFDMFLLNGYSRNNLLFPNIINLEYMFNDNDAEDFSIHNYFGLYLTENDFMTFNQVFKQENNTKNYKLKYFDTSNNIVDLNNSVVSIVENDQFNDRIFFASTKNAVTNLENLKDLNVFTKNEAVNMPDENLVQIKGTKMRFEEDEKAFLSMDFTKQIKYGEHFKFIIPKYKLNQNESKCVVFELIASNDHRLKTTQNNISPYVQTNIPDRLTEVDEEPTEIYRIAFYTQDLKNENELAPLEEQILRIGSAIKKFDSVLKVGSDGKESISIISSVKDVYMQHIMADEFIGHRDVSVGLLPQASNYMVSKTVSTGNREEYNINYFTDDTFQKYTDAYTDTTIDLDSIEVYDTLRYYNYNNVQKCEYIEYYNDLFDLHHIAYANNGLELTFERYANIVKFINIDEFSKNVIYEIDKDIYEETNSVTYPLIYTVNGYYPMVQFKNNDGDLTFSWPYNETRYDDKGVWTLNTSILGYSRFKLTPDNYISIISPHNVDKSIICSPYEIELVNEHINICSPLKLNIALMGINGVKDIDVCLNNDVTESQYTNVYATFKAGERIRLDNSDTRLKRFVTYSIIKGSIYGIPTSALNSFTILSDKIVYTNADNNTIQIIKLDSDILDFNEETILMLTSTHSLDIYNYDVNIPVLNEENYYVDSNNMETSKLSIPLVPSINCQWKTNGYYFDSMQLLDVNSLKYDYNTVGNFIECKYVPGETTQYVKNQLDDIINVNHNGNITRKSIFDYILETGSIKKYLCKNNKIETAIGYYNPYVQTLEFIFYGIKFIFKLTSNEYANEIKLNEYDNYEVYVINDYNHSDTNDIIISKKEEFILIVNHTYRASQLFGNSNIKMYKNGIMQDAEYDFYKTPFAYELNHISYTNNDNVYVNKSASNRLQNIEYAKSFVEIDMIKYDDKNLNLGEKDIFAYFTIDSGFKNYDNYDVYDTSLNVHVEKNEQIISYPFAYNRIKIDSDLNCLYKHYGHRLQDFTNKNGYIVESNDTDIDNIIMPSYEDKLNEYIKSFNNDFNIYIIEKDANESNAPIRNTQEYTPLTIQLSKPNKVKYNNGLFNPNFIDIFNFEINDEISDRIGLDTLYGNTCVSSINSIKNYYSNKILNTTGEKNMAVFKNSVKRKTRSANKIMPSYTYNYFIEEYRSPFSTNWDNNIYRSYINETEFTYLPGYSLGVNDKMFFGSKALNLHSDHILLTKWDYEENINVASFNVSKHNEHTKQKDILEIQLNLTKTFYDYILSQDTFISNWKNDVNSKVYINNYINNILYNIFNFKDNFDVTVYKQYSETLKFKKDLANNHFIKNTESIKQFDGIEENYKTEFNEINNEIILTISISNFENYIYYPTVKINKI